MVFNVVTCEKHTDAVNVFIDTIAIHARKIVVDHMHDIADIKTTTGQCSGDENRARPSAESSPVKV
jgi:hypothetical protein